MKYISFFLKLLPLITIISGLIGGGTRINPVIDTVKVALTQYELAQIANLVVMSFHGSNDLVKEPKQFPAFVRDKFHNQYSVLAREIKGDKEHDHSLDIWGQTFKLEYMRVFASVKVFSAGPDGEYNTKDDIAADIPYQNPDEQNLAREPKRRVIVEEVLVDDEPEEPSIDHEQTAEVDETIVSENEGEPDQREPATDQYSENEDMNEPSVEEIPVEEPAQTY